MKKEINESIKFLLSEYNRLKSKEKSKTISKEEKDTLRKLKIFIGKNNE
tara:strand:- start:4143 stop:4289 length:147 start_codon:yes stop_codon:yes gene_type:complete